MCCLFVWLLLVLIKEPISEEEPNVLNDPTPDGEHLSEDEGKSYWTSWSYCSYMYDCLEFSLVGMIIALLLVLLIDSRIMPCLHVVNHIFLDMRMHLLYDILLIIRCMSYMVGDRVFYDEYGWGRVSTTVGVRLRSRAIMVIDLSRLVCWGLRIVVVLTSHLTLFCIATRPCMGRA
jgi:hypothetical protein